MRMETREYIESIRMFNDEMGIICGVNLLDGNMREVVSPKSIVGIEEMVGILKNIKEKYETDLMISNQNLVQFEKYLSNLEVNVDSVCDLGSIAHLLILWDMKLKINYDRENITAQHICNEASNFETENLKEQAITKFLEKGLNPNLKDERGYTFIEAAIFGRPEFADIKRYGRGKMAYLGDLNNPNLNSFGFVIKLIKLAKERDFDVNTKDNLGNSIVHTAISSPYFECDIVELIKMLGENFDINACNADEMDIIQFLDYCINNKQAFSGYSDQNIVSRHIDNLKGQREKIVKYVMLNRNPLLKNLDTKEEFEAKLKLLQRQLDINKRMATFLDIEKSQTKFELDSVTIDELNSLLINELKTTKMFVKKIVSISREMFGKGLYKEVCKFIILGDGKNNEFIKILGEALNGKSSFSYPRNGSQIKKIEWLRNIINEVAEQKSDVLYKYLRVKRYHKKSKNNL